MNELKGSVGILICMKVLNKNINTQIFLLHRK